MDRLRQPKQMAEQTEWKQTDSLPNRQEKDRLTDLWPNRCSTKAKSWQTCTPGQTNVQTLLEELHNKGCALCATVYLEISERDVPVSRCVSVGAGH